MEVEGYFTSDYLGARKCFLDAAELCGARVESYVHPTARGLADESLAIDIATVGNAGTGRTILIASGTHGVEGFAGSGCQIALMARGIARDIARSAQLVLVHAVNPYGFSHMRRVNEDNIDLNRNFIDFSKPTPLNAAYDEYARRYLPAGGGEAEYEMARARLEEAALEHDAYAFFKRATQPGQYVESGGLYYGGREPAWSARTFRQICRARFSESRAVGVIDIHSGLGPPGVGEVIFLDECDARRFTDRISPPVSSAGGNGSVSNRVEGPLFSAACQDAKADFAICCALEFGTVPLRENVEAMIFENWADTHFRAGHPLRERARARLRAAYFTDETDWKRQIVERTIEVTGSVAALVGSEAV